MAVYRTVHTSFWQDPGIIEMAPEEKAFYIYLLTNPYTKQCGIYELSKQAAGLHTGYSLAQIDSMLALLQQRGRILYAPDTYEVCIVNWVRYNAVSSPNVEKCVLRELKAVKHKPFVELFLERCEAEGQAVPLLLAYFRNEQQPEAESRTAALYEQLIGPVTDTIAGELEEWESQLAPMMVREAVRIAAQKDKREWSYIKGILRRWKKNGYTQGESRPPQGVPQDVTALLREQGWPV